MSTNDHWITCPYCAGAGISRADQGMFTDDEITEIGEPLKAKFRASAYDRWCRACVGTGKILASRRAVIDPRSADERASRTRLRVKAGFAIPLVVLAQHTAGGSREERSRSVPSDCSLYRVLDVFWSGAVRPRHPSHLIIRDVLRQERLWGEKCRIGRGIRILRGERQDPARSESEAKGHGAVQVQRPSLGREPAGGGGVEFSAFETSDIRPAKACW